MNAKAFIITSTTFVLFFIEAIIHYNIGHPSDGLVFPVGKELFQIIITVMLFSALSGVVSEFIIKIFFGTQSRQSA